MGEENGVAVAQDMRSQPGKIGCAGIAARRLMDFESSDRMLEFPEGDC